jgi:hypothetical protein
MQPAAAVSGPLVAEFVTHCPCATDMDPKMPIAGATRNENGRRKNDISHLGGRTPWYGRNPQCQADYGKEPANTVAVWQHMEQNAFGGGRTNTLNAVATLLRVKPGKAQCKQMTSAIHPEADIATQAI